MISIQKVIINMEIKSLFNGEEVGHILSLSSAKDMGFQSVIVMIMGMIDGYKCRVKMVNGQWLIMESNYQTIHIIMELL